MTDMRAIIADDEEHLRSHLKSLLGRLWPELKVVGEAENGFAALLKIEKMAPEIVFLDIKMPGLSGLEVAGKVKGKCRLVFITAYDHFAVAAFESNAVDYILKPVTEKRLAETVARLQKKSTGAIRAAANIEIALKALLKSAQKSREPDYLNLIKVQSGSGIRLIPVSEIFFFRARDKYTTVKTKASETLIRKSIQDLAAELNPDQFWRVHRSTIVNITTIDKIEKSFSGRMVIKLKGQKETLDVSRAYAHLFKQM